MTLKERAAKSINTLIDNRGITLLISDTVSHIPGFSDTVSHI